MAGGDITYNDDEDLHSISLGSSLYDNLPTGPENLNVRVFMVKYSDVLQEHNPNQRAEQYLKETIAKLEAVLATLADRKT